MLLVTGGKKRWLWRKSMKEKIQNVAALKSLQFYSVPTSIRSLTSLLNAQLILNIS